MRNKIGIDWSQRSTRLGAITLIAAAIAVVLICLGEEEKASAVMALAATVIGTLGLAVKD
jgi:hypothetical protein